MPVPLREAVADSTLQALDKLMRLAIQEKVDFVVLSGDLYDSKDRPLREQVRLVRMLEVLHEHGIRAFIIHGNHDPLLEGSMADLRLPPSTVIFGAAEAASVTAVNRHNEPIAYVSGISYGKQAVTDNLARQLAALPGPRDPLFHIALLHANVNGSAEHDNYAPCRLQDLTNARIDYWALGHIHTRSVLHESPWAVYPGNIQGRHFRELGPKGCYVVNVDHYGQASLTFHALDAVRWAEQTIDLTGVSSEQELLERAEQTISKLKAEGEGRHVLARLHLSGRSSLYRALHRKGALDGLLETLREQEGWHEGRTEHGGAVWVVSIDSHVSMPIARSQLLQEQSFLGDVLRLAEEAANNDLLASELLEEALQLLEPKAAQSVAEDSEERSRLLQEAEQWLLESLLDEELAGGSSEGGA